MKINFLWRQNLTRLHVTTSEYAIRCVYCPQLTHLMAGYITTQYVIETFYGVVKQSRKGASEKRSGERKQKKKKNWGQERRMGGCERQCACGQRVLRYTAMTDRVMWAVKRGQRRPDPGLRNNRDYDTTVD